MTNEYDYLDAVSKLIQSDIEKLGPHVGGWLKPGPDSDGLWLVDMNKRSRTTQALWSAIIDEVGTLDGWLIHIVKTWASDLIAYDTTPCSDPDDMDAITALADSFVDCYYSHMRYWLTNDRESVRWDAVDEAINEYGYSLAGVCRVAERARVGLWEAIPAAQGTMAETVLRVCCQWLEDYEVELKLLVTEGAE